MNKQADSTNRSDANPGADRLSHHADAMYSALLAAHHGLTDQESARLNARLVLLMMNHIGEPAAIGQILAAGRAAREKPSQCR